MKAMRKAKIPKEPAGISKLCERKCRSIALAWMTRSVWDGITENKMLVDHIGIMEKIDFNSST